jgi:hypothetical protein
MSDEHQPADAADDLVTDDLMTDEEGGYEVDVVEVEVAVVPIDVVEVDAETAYAARDAAEESRAHEVDSALVDAAQDQALDAALDQLDEGATEVREAADDVGTGELPMLIPGHDRFARLEPLPVTGDARVDAATARLDELAHLPTADHVAVYDDVHHRLQDALSDADPT